MAKQKQTRGGYRAGSGRPSEYKEETTSITFRVPVSKKDELKKAVHKMLAGWKTKKP